jgi:hypothetical protein
MKTIAIGIAIAGVLLMYMPVGCTPGITPAQACHSGFCVGGCCK